jgi:uncharacterized protein DUF6622
MQRYEIMMLDILRDTPLWVWCVAGFVLWRGHTLTRPQITSGSRLFALPAAFLVISLVAAVTTFDAGAPVIVAWALGALTATFAWVLRPQPADLLFNRQNRTYRVPGSWAPLVLIIVAFCARYAIGIALAQHGDLRASRLFGMSSALIFGGISGAFLGRALNLVGAGSFIISEKIPGRRAPEDVL